MIQRTVLQNTGGFRNILRSGKTRQEKKLQKYSFTEKKKKAIKNRNESEDKKTVLCKNCMFTVKIKEIKKNTEISKNKI